MLASQAGETGSIPASCFIKGVMQKVYTAWRLFSVIDLLVDSLEYTNRSDFCRIAIKELLEATVQKIKVYGKIQAQEDVMAVIKKKEKR